MSDGTAQIARGVAVTFVGYAGKLARPVALAVFARLYGLAPLGVALLVWAWVEVVARIAGLGLDRGLQRWVPATAPEQRAGVVGAALLAAAIASLPIALVLAAVLPSIVGVAGGDALAVRLAVLFLLPVTTVAVTALHAVRGTKQIVALVWGRSVVEPGGFLIGGLVLALFSRGAPALLGAYAVSLGLVATVAVVTLDRAFGLRAIAHALRAGGLPVRKLLAFSIPLGVADVLQLALQRGDVVAVGLVTGSAPATAAYAVAREVVTSISKIRQGFDQVLAPVAAELHVGARRAELANAASSAARWSAVIATPLALVFAVYGDAVLRIFGVSSTAAATALAILAIGRLVDAATGPTAILLAMVGRPRLVLINSLAGLVVAICGAALLGPRLGSIGVAAATSAGLVTVNLLALVWLDRLEELRPVAGLARPAVAALAGAVALIAIRAAVGIGLAPALAIVLAAWLAGYLGLAISLGLLPASWIPWRRAAVEVI